MGAVYSIQRFPDLLWRSDIGHPRAGVITEVITQYLGCIIAQCVPIPAVPTLASWSFAAAENEAF